MLVLTRRSNEKISFPQVGITVHFVRIQSGHVKVGVEAPRDIAIVRDEIACDGAAEALVRKQLLRLPRDVRLALRTQIGETREGTQLYRELVKAGMLDEAEETFVTLQRAFSRLEEHELLRNPEGNRLPSVPGAIVLIDDAANEREMLAGFLRLRGHHVVCFGSGTDAIAYLSASERPRLVLINMRMSVCDSAAIVREMRLDERSTVQKLFAIGCTSPQEFGLESGDQGLNRWFPKPLNPRFLIEALEGGSVDGEDLNRDVRRRGSPMSTL